MILFGEINEDGVRIADDGAVVVQHRHLAEAVHLQERGRLVRAGPEVDLYQLVGNTEQRQEQVRAMGMAGQRVIIELHHFLPEAVQPRQDDYFISR